MTIWEITRQVNAIIAFSRVLLSLNLERKPQYSFVYFVCSVLDPLPFFHLGDGPLPQSTRELIVIRVNACVPLPRYRLKILATLVLIELGRHNREHCVKRAFFSRLAYSQTL